MNRERTSGMIAWGCKLYTPSELIQKTTKKLPSLRFMTPSEAQYSFFAQRNKKKNHALPLRIGKNRFLTKSATLSSIDKNKLFENVLYSPKLRKNCLRITAENRFALPFRPLVPKHLSLVWYESQLWLYAIPVFRQGGVGGRRCVSYRPLPSSWSKNELGQTKNCTVQSMNPPRFMRVISQNRYHLHFDRSHHTFALNFRVSKGLAILRLSFFL